MAWTGNVYRVEGRIVTPHTPYVQQTEQNCFTASPIDQSLADATSDAIIVYHNQPTEYKCPNVTSGLRRDLPSVCLFVCFS